MHQNTRNGRIHCSVFCLLQSKIAPTSITTQTENKVLVPNLVNETYFGPYSGDNVKVILNIADLFLITQQGGAIIMRHWKSLSCKTHNEKKEYRIWQRQLPNAIVDNKQTANRFRKITMFRKRFLQVCPAQLIWKITMLFQKQLVCTDEADSALYRSLAWFYLPAVITDQVTYVGESTPWATSRKRLHFSRTTTQW